MIIQNADLFSDMSLDAIKEISMGVIEEHYDSGDKLFLQNDRADYFYTLIEGRVQLAVGKEAQIDYTVSRPGEIFGLSSMLDRECYTADAQCVMPSRVAKLEKKKLDTVLEKYPKDATLFFKHLSSCIMARLISNYDAFLTHGSLKGVTCGSGQVILDNEE